MTRIKKHQELNYGTLEERKLFACIEGVSGASIHNDGTQIHVVGTELNDSVNVFELEDGLTRITLANSIETIHYDFSDEGQIIDVELQHGNDIFENHGVGLINHVNGGEGNDYIQTGSQSDLVYAGEGDDQVYSGAGEDLIYGGPGFDILFAGDGADTVFAGLQGDVVYGGAGNDKIKGGRGHDEIHGEGGQDDILGSRGNDRIYGGEGSDHILGGEGEDVIRGGSGNDFLGGQSYWQYLNQVNVGWQLEWFDFAGFEDSLGRGDFDRIYGGDGVDRLYGYESDKLVGGSNDDTFFVFGDLQANGIGPGASDANDIARTYYSVNPNTDNFKNIDHVFNHYSEGSSGGSAGSVGGSNSSSGSSSGSGSGSSGGSGGSHSDGSSGGNQNSTSGPEIEIDGFTNEQLENVIFGIRQEGQNVSRELTIHNTGDETLFITDVSAPSGIELSQSSPMSIAAGHSAVLTVGLNTSFNHHVDGVLKIHTNDADEALIEVELSGTVINQVSTNRGSLLSYDVVQSDSGIMVLKSVQVPGAGGNNQKLFADFHNLSGHQTKWDVTVGDHGNYGNQRIPASTALDNGNFAVAWHLSEPTSTQGIRYAVVTPLGASIGSPERMANVDYATNYSNLSIQSINNGFKVNWNANVNGDATSLSRNFNFVGVPTGDEY